MKTVLVKAFVVNLIIINFSFAGYLQGVVSVKGVVVSFTEKNVTMRDDFGKHFRVLKKFTRGRLVVGRYAEAIVGGLKDVKIITEGK